MASQITATLPTLDFPREVDYPTQEDWAAFSAAAEENFGILGGDWSTQMQLWKTEANAMSVELNNNASIAQGLANYQGDWTSKGYTLGQSVSVSGVYYICKLTHATGQNPTVVGSTYWNLAIGNWNLKVNNYGDETITGIKSFSSKILTPNLAYKDTAITITSWSYVGTTITLNVASHTFVAGDYIEVSGLTATTYPANGVQLVTIVTSTTIVFTLGATPTGTAGVSSATVKGYVTVNGRVSESIGVNQTYQDVTASRINNITYYNTTGKPIYVIVNSANGTTEAGHEFYINNIRICTSSVAGVDLATSQFQVTSVIVPPNSSYKAVLISGTLASWFELK